MPGPIIPSVTTVMGLVGPEKGQNLLTDGGVMAYVQVALGEPALENIRLVNFREHYADDNLGG